jgi:tetratricopeptide (TPR) repeat protein
MMALMLADIGIAYLELADYDKAEYYMSKALVIKPDNLGLMSFKGFMYEQMQELDNYWEVIQFLNSTNTSEGLWHTGNYFLYLKDYNQSVKNFDEYYSKTPETAYGGLMHLYAYALLKVGRVEEANRWFEITLKGLREQRHVTPDYEFAKIYAALGMRDSAYHRLERVAVGPGTWGIVSLLDIDPLFEDIRDEPEFQRLAGVFKDRVRVKLEEVRKLEESGEIPKNLDEIELY